MDLLCIKNKSDLINKNIKTPFSREKINNDQRMETILDAILLPIIGLLTMLFLIILYNTVGLKDNYDFRQTTGFLFIIVVFVALFLISKRGYVRIAAYGTVAVCFAGSFYCGYRWGASLPETLLCFALTMGVTNLLFGVKTSIVATTVSFATIIYLSGHEINHPEILSWQDGNLDMTDFIAYFGIIAFMFGLSWISRSQMARSLARAETSEKALTRERDLLEIRVAERTLELRLAQEKRISELDSIAEFGRLSQGLFHDLISPISSLILHIEKLSTLPREKEIRESKESIQKMCASAKKFSGYLSSLRTSVGCPSVKTSCCFEEELEHVFNLLAFNARAHSVSYKNPEKYTGIIPFGPVDVHQILFNLISNAIDSYKNINDDRKRLVLIKTELREKNFLIEIADNSCGIPSNVLPHIFDCFFTTKEKGTGIGLSTVKRIVNSFGGNIAVESKVGKGTRFEVTLPFRDKV